MTVHAHDEHHGLGHVLPVSTLAKVLGALVALTVLTVITGKMDLYGFDLAVAMIIATTKAVLVALIFMHLKYDRGFHGFIFLGSLLFVGVFLAYTMTDTAQYQGDIRQFNQQSVAEELLNPLDDEADPGAGSPPGNEGH